MTDEEYIEGLGRAIRRERERLGWTQRELARRCHTSQAHICGLEAGSPRVRLTTVRRVAQALGVPLVCLLSTEPVLQELLREPECQTVRKIVELGWIGSALPWVALGHVDYVLHNVGDLLGETCSADEFAATYPELTVWLRTVVGPVE